MRNHSIQSCGCLRKENAAKLFTKHGGCKGKRDKLYFVWRDIKARTSNSKHERYNDYGGRGITMCDEWFNDYKTFKTWSIANGYRENAPRGECTIDRIDVNGNYEPSNCRYITIREQASNKRNNSYFTFYGITNTVAEWARQCNVTRSALEYRIKKYGWEQALSMYLEIDANGKLSIRFPVFKELREEGKEVSYS